MLKKTLVLALTLTPFISYAACQNPDLEIKDAYVLGGPGLPIQKNTAGYVNITNKSKEKTYHLISAKSTIAKRTELHTIEHSGSNMKMVQVDRYTIAPGKDLSLTSGGNHLMFIGLKESLKTGEPVKVTLVFDDNQKHTFECEQDFTIRDMKGLK